VLRLFIFLVMLLSLVGCGFHLRGPVTLAPSMDYLYLKSADPYGLLARSLKQYLKLSGVHLTQTAQSANMTLDLGREQITQQALSISGTQQTRQYNLILSVTFQILDPQGQVLLASQTVSESRTLPIQSNQILAGSTEANNLYNQMRAALVYDMIIRLSATDTIDILMKKPHEIIPPAIDPDDV